MIHEIQTHERPERHGHILRKAAVMALVGAGIYGASYEVGHPPAPIDSYITSIETGSTPQEAVEDAAKILAEQHGLEQHSIDNIVIAAQDVSHEITESEGSVQPGTLIEVTLYKEDHVIGPDSYSVGAHKATD